MDRVKPRGLGVSVHDETDVRINRMAFEWAIHDDEAPEKPWGWRDRLRYWGVALVMSLLTGALAPPLLSRIQSDELKPQGCFVKGDVGWLWWLDYFSDDLPVGG